MTQSIKNIGSNKIIGCLRIFRQPFLLLPTKRENLDKMHEIFRQPEIFVVFMTHFFKEIHNEDQFA